MCDALRFKNHFEIISDDCKDPLQDTVDTFQPDIIAKTITGVINKDTSHGVFFMFCDGSVIGIYQHGITISDKEMVLSLFSENLVKIYEDEHGGVDRVRHDG